MAKGFGTIVRVVPALDVQDIGLLGRSPRGSNCDWFRSSGQPRQQRAQGEGLPRSGSSAPVGMVGVSRANDEAAQRGSKERSHEAGNQNGDKGSAVRKKETGVKPENPSNATHPDAATTRWSANQPASKPPRRQDHEQRDQRIDTRNLVHPDNPRLVTGQTGENCNEELQRITDLTHRLIRVKPGMGSRRREKGERRSNDFRDWRYKGRRRDEIKPGISYWRSREGKGMKWDTEEGSEREEKVIRENKDRIVSKLGREIWHMRYQSSIGDEGMKRDAEWGDADIRRESVGRDLRITVLETREREEKRRRTPRGRS
ncbi:hypothetical protein WN48_04671 [Eufriesea mexicana]|uniref:Uncharacterized protein n=1 Tax=Eufriesea mexicana TaxID=516756 RepID=A0A310STR0_9HYME|nr:hypothetical protein WN48_04671 [Eufriesea mexicana]